MKWLVFITLALSLMSVNAHSEDFMQSSSALINGQPLAVAYSGFREGQHPDRGEGANNPSDQQILEDLSIMLEHGLTLIRLYDSGENSAATLRLIESHKLPIKVLLGMWLEAQVSNHLGCPWLEEPIPEDKLRLNTLKNQQEIQRGIQLSNTYSSIVVAVNVGNEALVEWNDHMVSLEDVIQYVRQVKSQITQPVTVADNYEWWIQEGAPLAAEVDFLGVHTYPAWENKTIGQALDYTIENIQQVQQALPNKPIAILEAGWATTAVEFAEQANESNQKRYLQDMITWAKHTNTTVFFFEAFDEPWKGDPNNAVGAEKHWGIFYVDRSPKSAAKMLLVPKTK